jgi:hypothetical protein
MTIQELYINDAMGSNTIRKSTPQMTATALALYDLPTRYNELSYLCKKDAREH